MITAMLPGTDLLIALDCEPRQTGLHGCGRTAEETDRRRDYCQEIVDYDYKLFLFDCQ